MTRRTNLALLVLANILTPIALLIYATGFFPYKPFIPGQARFKYDDHGTDNVAPPFDKVIFMVIDALRRYEPFPSRACSGRS